MSLAPHHFTLTLKSSHHRKLGHHSTLVDRAFFFSEWYPDEIHVLADKDRTFDPTLNPQYANKLGLPMRLLYFNPILKVTHLRIRSNSASAHQEFAELDTVIMIVGGRKIRGYTATARWFGADFE